MTQDEIYEIAWKIFPISDKENNETFIALLTYFAKLVAEKERETCAKICDEWANSLSGEPEMVEMAKEIRARSNA